MFLSLCPPIDYENKKGRQSDFFIDRSPMNMHRKAGKLHCLKLWTAVPFVLQAFPQIFEEVAVFLAQAPMCHFLFAPVSTY